MPTTRKTAGRRGQEEKNRKNRLTEKASSFHGRLPAEMAEPRIRRPKTLPDLLGGRKVAAGLSPEKAALPKLTKLLLNVTVQGCVGAVQVLMSPEATVSDLIVAAVRQYKKEGRRPILNVDPSRFDLHYSQFSLESLDRQEKLMALGSRNFFLCPKRSAVDGGFVSGLPATTTSPSCSKEAEKVTKSGFPWLKFMEFLL